MKKLPSLTLLLGLLAASACAQEAAPRFTRTEDVIYGRKFGTTLTLDVLQPDKPNRCAVLLMVSGGWFSSHDAINAKYCQPLLERGYTVFAVVHGSQPKFQIPEIIQDVHRAVRFVRHNAKRWDVDPDKFGITGGSAGGHLSLVLATQGGPGKPGAKDPVDRESSAVQAVACFYPPTDFLNWSQPGEDQVGVGRVGTQFKAAFGPRSDTAETRQVYGREISPLYFVTSNLPPTLIVHGDADKVVPIYQAEIFVKKCREVNAPVKLELRPGKDHGWTGMEKDIALFADWFDEHLRGIRK
jgi:acetyl esterase/lipase